MSKEPIFKEQLELEQLLARQQELVQRQLEFERNQRRLQQTQAENECTIPPLDELLERARHRNHEEMVSRGEIANVRREHNHSLLLLLLLLAATSSLVWWGLRVMADT
ncbi:MAG: hypothetical protein ACO3RV_06085 [Luteolibacter sp.]